MCHVSKGQQPLFKKSLVIEKDMSKKQKVEINLRLKKFSIPKNVLYKKLSGQKMSKKMLSKNIFSQDKFWVRKKLATKEMLSSIKR